MKALAASLLVVTAGGLAALPGAAAEYKWIDQNGNVVYGDHPPDESAVALRRPGGLTVTQTVKAPVDPTLQFPLALREAARANPVSLYVANDCQPCQMAAQHLRLRGIPFQEWKVTSNADFERFKALGFAGNGFPAISVGSQRSVGYEGNAWNRMLDSARYPTESVLPSSYQYPPAANLSPDIPMQGATAFRQPPRIIDASEVLPAGGERRDPSGTSGGASGGTAAPSDFRF